MNKYEELGFFDFEDYIEELNEEELFCVNGGACSGGGAVTPSVPHYSGSCSGGGAVTPSMPYNPSPTCGGGYNSNNQGSFKYILNNTVKNAKMQDYEKNILLDYSMNGKGYAFSKKGCKMMGFAKILSAVKGSFVSILEINNKYDKGKDGLIGRDEIGDALKQNAKGKKVSVALFDSGLSKEQLDSIARDKGDTYVLGKAINVAGGDHWIVLEGYTTNSYGQVEFAYNGTSKNDAGRKFILGEPTAAQKRNNYFQITAIETFNIQ